ncbi:hypothetical protein DRN76_00050 [Methanosarcinales archaeon]|nr:MAG: hypothetical protein DRN76_00050 [Methanosarcinales archaeon]
MPEDYRRGFLRQEYLKQRKTKRLREVAIIGLLACLLLALIVLTFWDEKMEDTLRPQHCDDTGCVKAEVFEDLPDFPADFQDKKIMVMTGRMMDLDRIGEEYWKQPEFYENSFESQCIQYYTGKANIKFSAGSGGYPADMVIKNASRGDVFKVKTFWHTGCGIHKYQAFGLEQITPSEMSIRLSDIKIVQDPETAKKCFDVRMIPEEIILSPSYPKYTYNWTQQVDAEITVSDKCPKGFYGIQFMPSALPDKRTTELLMKYGATKMTTMYVGGLWQIAIEVV